MTHASARPKVHCAASSVISLGLGMTMMAEQIMDDSAKIKRERIDHPYVAPANVFDTDMLLPDYRKLFRHDVSREICFNKINTRRALRRVKHIGARGALRAVLE